MIIDEEDEEDRLSGNKINTLVMSPFEHSRGLSYEKSALDISLVEGNSNCKEDMPNRI